MFTKSTTKTKIWRIFCQKFAHYSISKTTSSFWGTKLTPELYKSKSLVINLQRFRLPTNKPKSKFSKSYSLFSHTRSIFALRYKIVSQKEQKENNVSQITFAFWTYLLSLLILKNCISSAPLNSFHVDP